LGTQVEGGAPQPPSGSPSIVLFTFSVLTILNTPSFGLQIIVQLSGICIVCTLPPTLAKKYAVPPLSIGASNSLQSHPQQKAFFCPSIKLFQPETTPPDPVV